MFSPGFYQPYAVAVQTVFMLLCALRDEVIAMGVLPAIDQWHALNPNID